MSSEKQEFSFPGYTADQLLLYAYGAFGELEWTVKYAGPVAIVAYTPKTWSKYEDEVMVEVNDGGIVVTSSLIHNESFDVMKKNKKHINDFVAMFEKVKLLEADPSWASAIEKIREQTIKVVKEQEQQAQDVDKVMKLSGSNLYATYAIIAINVVVFILMVINGAGLFEPNSIVHIKWGSNYSPLTLSGDWWRMITSTFLHFGIIHIALNMFALYMAGTYLEPMLGKVKYITAYLCTGVLANIISLWWHDKGVNGAGASGAIFGLYGVFIALLLTNLIPKRVRTSLLQSMLVFLVLNILYGIKTDVDNSAHIGGALSGAVIGFLYYFLLKKEVTGTKQNLMVAGVIGVTALSTWMYLSAPGNKISPETRRVELNYIKEASFPDAEVFFKKYREFADLDQTVATLLNDTTENYGEWLSKNEKEIEKKIAEMESIVSSMKNFKVADVSKKKIDLLDQFVQARKEEMSALKSLTLENIPANRLKLADIRQKQGELIAEINRINL